MLIDIVNEGICLWSREPRRVMLDRSQTGKSKHNSLSNRRSSRRISAEIRHPRMGADNESDQAT